MARAFSMEDSGSLFSRSKVPTPQKTIGAVQPFGLGGAASVAAPRGQSWDDYKGTLEWNNSDVNNGIGGLAKQIGYGGPIQERTGRQVSMGEGESGPMMTDEWGPASGLSDAMKNYRFETGVDSGGNRSAKVYDQAGNQVGGDWRTGSTGGSMMKFMSKAIPALVMGGFGAGALGALGGAGAGEALGAAAGGADAATSAAWANGAAGLGGDTLSAMGLSGAEAAAGSGALGIPGATYALPGAESGMGLANVAADTAAATAPELASQLPSIGPVVGSEAALPAMTSSSGFSSLLEALGGAGSAVSSAAGGAGQILKDNPTLGTFAKGAAGALGAGLATKALVGSSPTTPDAGQLTQQQSAANLQAAQQQAQLNRVDTTTPFGFQKFGQVADPSVPGGIRYTQEIGLSPEQQKLYDAETGNQIASQGIASKMQGRVAASVANPLDLSKSGQLEKAMSGDAFSADKDKVTQALFERLTSLRKPQMDKDREALDVKLRNQGLMPGTEAYDNGMRTMLESQNTELSDAADRALLAGGAEQSRLQGDARANSTLNNNVQQASIQQQLLERQQPLAEYNSFRTGNTPTLPQFQPFGLSSVAPTNTTAAANTAYGSAADQYNAKIAQLQSLLNFGTSVAKP